MNSNLKENTKEFIDYVIRYSRCTNESCKEIAGKLLVKEVAREYGCTEQDIALIDWSKYE